MTDGQGHTTPRDDDRSGTATERVLEVRVQDPEEFVESSEAALDAALDGDPRPATLAFETPGQVFALFTDARYELLAAIRRTAPGSIRALAREVGRDASAVHRDLDALAEYGVVEFEEDGRAKRPRVAYEEVRVTVDLAFGDAADEREGGTAPSA